MNNWNREKRLTSPQLKTPTAAPQFRQGDAEWDRLRAKALGDLFWFAGVVLGYGDLIPMKKGPHGLLCKFIECKTGVPQLDTARYRKIEMPRETGKTTICSEARVIQRICMNPNIAILLANEKEQNARDFLAEIKHQFESNEFLRGLFPEVIPPDFNDTTWSASRIIVKRTSGRKEPTVSVIGVGGTVTGMHYDLIVCDDLISREAMENARAGSWQIMHQVNRWIHQLEPLLSSNAEPFPEVVFIGTRWWHKDCYEHIEDAFGYGEPKQPFLLKMKLESGEMQMVTAWRQGDLAIFRRAAIEDGRSIFPEKWTLERLARIRVRDEALFACLPPGEQILTYDGPRAIETIDTNTIVFTKDGQWRSVVATNGRRYTGTMVRVTTWGQSNAISLTANHKVWAQPARQLARAWQYPPDEYAWTAAEELRPGDVLPVPIDATELRPEGLFGDEGFWFLVGHFIGDGTIGKTGAIAHCFDKRHTALAARIAEIIRRLFGRKARIEEQRATLRITYRHPLAVSFFREVSHGIGQKWLPQQYERWDLNCQRALVDGYWSADGCTTSTGHRVATSVSATWLCQLQRILARLGVVASMTKPKVNTTRIEGRTVNAQPLYHLWIYTCKSNRRRKAWIADGVLYRRVRKVEHIEYDGPVFNCEVREDHSYVSALNAISYANCNYMNEPSDDQTATFKSAWLQYYDWLDDATLRFTDGAAAKRTYAVKDLDVLIFVDPGGFGARQIEDRANAAIIVTGSTSRGEHLILEADSEKDTFLGCIRKVLDKVGRYNPRRVYVEQAGQQAAFVELLRQNAKDANLAMSLDIVKPGTQHKEVRILTLEPYFQRGQMYLGKSAAFTQFTQQYKQFPRAARLDLLDALGYGPQCWRKQPTNRLNHTQRQQSELESYYQKRGLSRR